MSTRVPRAGGLALVAAAILSLAGAAKAQDGALTRPSHYAACSAWSTHVQDLIDQHRLTTEISDSAFDTALRLFAEARDACSAGRFEDAFHIYSIMPLGRPLRASLR